MTIDGNSAMLIGAGGGLLLLRTVLGVADSNLVLVSRPRLRDMADEGVKRAKALEQLLEDRHAVHTSLAIARSTMSVLLGAIAVWVPLHLGQSPTVEALSLGVTILATLFFELAARRLAWVNTERMALAMVPIYVLTQRVTLPFAWSLGVMASALARLFGRPHVERERGVTEDDIRLMVEAGRDLEDSEKEMIHSIFELSETIARELMVPRVDMVAVEKSTPLRNVLDLCLEKGLSRLPVYAASIDNVVGIVMTKDLLVLMRDGRMETATLEGIARAAFFVPGSKRVSELLREMQRHHVAMAIVVDEYGGTDGLITMEDLIEEIVGEITDEYDKEEPPVEKLSDGSVLVDAKMIIEDVNELLDTDIPADEYETIGGYVYGLLGHVPKEGEKAEVDGLSIRVEQVQRQRIKRLRLQRLDGQGFALRERDLQQARK